MNRFLIFIVGSILLAGCSNATTAISRDSITQPLTTTEIPVTFTNWPTQPLESYPAATIAPLMPYPGMTTATAAPYPPPGTATPSATGTPVVFPLLPTYLMDAVFADRKHGWVVGTALLGDSRVYAMAATSDSGATWQALTLPNINAHYFEGQAGSIFLADGENGWFYVRGLFSTHDGGQTWVDEKPAGRIATMARALDGSIWALENTNGVWTLWKVSTKPYKSWQRFRAEFPVDPSLAQLIMLDSEQAWLTHWTPDPQGGYISHIWVTHDGAQTWHEIHSPCNDYATNGGVLSVVDNRVMWLGCGWPAGAGSGTKFVFSSSDGGLSWTLRGKGAALADDTLTTLGYFSDLKAITSSFVYMTWNRIPSVVITRDGGKTWEYPRVPCAFDYSKAVFIDTEYGWMFEQDCISRTRDGGRNWECTILPENKSCQP